MKYDNRLEIRLSTQQKEQLYGLAGEKSTVSELIRKQLLFEPSRQEKKTNQEISNELKRIGNNLNQIAKVLNSTHLYETPIRAGEIVELKENLEIVKNKMEVLEQKLEV